MSNKLHCEDKRAIQSDSKKINLLVVETEEIYHYMYRLLPERSNISLLDVADKFEGNAVNLKIELVCPDVLLVGLKRYESSIGDDLEKICLDNPGLGVVIILSSCTSKDILGLRKLVIKCQGGKSILLRQSLEKVDHLVELVQSTSQGGTVLDQKLTCPIFNISRINSFLNQLTPREMETLNLLANGYTNMAIAEALFINIKTVERYLNNIYGKLKTDIEIDRRHPRVSAARIYLQETGNSIAF